MTPEEIATQRAKVVAEAISAIGTPYHTMGMIKGPQGGLDCGTLLVKCFTDTGVVEPFELAPYAPDWHLHRNAERYLTYILNRTTEQSPIDERIPEPGDILVWKFGRVFAHGAIVENWPIAIHAYSKTRCERVDVEKAKYLKFIGEDRVNPNKLRPLRVFSLKQWVTE